ncbi:ABC transporter permease [Canibacter oris]|uniref:Peptide/nickel transport system permease protein n=1 Tax=Canibacter oris TaxID=1365628 RepID=A0A840DNM7_9MICO|nr:ABC transporter permease [Canibacter oris]MBB4070806.1 peptide/nickel transport system permease protein [Canibacter oris]
MLKYILRRLGSSVLVMFGASILMFVLVINAGDPLADLRENTSANRDYLMQQRIETMGLDLPWYERYLNWLGGVSKCFIGQCDFGMNRSGQSVNETLLLAASATLRLVIIATLLAIVIGIAVGIVTAIRQYSGLDYAVTLLTFLFFSLPVFWAAVLLKEYMAIGFNNWIANPEYSPLAVTIVAILGALVVQAAMAGDLKRRLLTAGVTAAFIIISMMVMNFMNFAQHPQLGPAGVLAIGVAVAVIATVLMAGLQNRKVLLSGLITAAIGFVAYYATFWLLDDPNWFILFLLALLAVGIGIAVGNIVGGYSRRVAATVGGITAFMMGLAILADKVFLYWPVYLNRVSRPIGTIGSETPNFSGSFWEVFIDKGTQLLLPTILLTLVSIASYSRYTRGSMLEVSRQDYIRTARAKGLNERQVILKHAFRNSLIPITTIMAFDFAGLIGGAVITEKVFGWKGMGDLFKVGLEQVDPAPVMAFFVVTGFTAILFNLLADILYAVLDPRIRV